MADKLLTLDMKTSEADGAGVMGKFVNIYESIASLVFLWTFNTVTAVGKLKKKSKGTWDTRWW